MTVVFEHHGERLLYRVREVAELLCISPAKMWEIVGRGDIESVKIDGSRRIARSAVEAYVAGLAGGGDAPAS